MKKILFLTMAAMLVLGTAALGDSLSVTSTAAMGGVADQNCMGDGMPGPCGLAVDHDNLSTAYVQDDTPAAETIYRAEFLFDPQGVCTSQSSGPLRQEIFRAISPNPATPSCTAEGIVGAFVSSIKIYLQCTGGVGDTTNLIMVTRGNSCGELAAAPRTMISATGPIKLCLEYEAAGGGNGRIAYAVEDIANSCGTGPWIERTGFNNNLTPIEIVRMGTTATNSFGRGEAAVMFFDEFASFRTLAP